MKKFIFILITNLFIINVANAQINKFTFQVKDGKNNIVNLEEDDVNYSKIKETIGESSFYCLVNDINYKCKRKCKYPVTYVPTFIHFTLEDTITVNIDTLNINLYRYKYMVIGYAKNSMGVENEICSVDISKDIKPNKTFNRITEVYDFYETYAPCFITNKAHVMNKGEYDLITNGNSNPFKDKKIELFNYNGWEYYIIFN